MSPRIRLVCYPAGDAAFATASTASLDIDLPDATADLMGAVLAHLRVAYPNVHISVDDGSSHDVADWHVYRDGLPS